MEKQDDSYWEKAGNYKKNFTDRGRSRTANPGFLGNFSGIIVSCKKVGNSIINHRLKKSVIDITTDL